MRLYLFESSSRFTTKLKGYRESSYTSSLYTYAASPIANITHQNGFLLLFLFFVCFFFFFTWTWTYNGTCSFFYMQPNPLQTDKVKTACQSFLLTDVFDETLTLVSVCQYNCLFFEQVQNPSLYIFCKRYKLFPK